MQIIVYLCKLLLLYFILTLLMLTASALRDYEYSVHLETKQRH